MRFLLVEAVNFISERRRSAVAILKRRLAGDLGRCGGSLLEAPAISPDGNRAAILLGRRNGIGRGIWSDLPFSPTHGGLGCLTTVQVMKPVGVGE